MDDERRKIIAAVVVHDFVLIQILAGMARASPDPVASVRSMAAAAGILVEMGDEYGGEAMGAATRAELGRLFREVERRVAQQTAEPVTAAH